jgi:hypothetical protein
MAFKCSVPLQNTRWKLFKIIIIKYVTDIQFDSKEIYSWT